MAASKVRTARNLSGLTQIQLADAVHVSESTIKRIEQGTQRPDQFILEAVAEVTGCQWVANPLIPDDYTPSTKSQAFVGLYAAVQDVSAVLPKLAGILADNKVDNNEVQDFENCLAVIGNANRHHADMCYAK